MLAEGGGAGEVPNQPTMPRTHHSIHTLGDIVVRYPFDPANGRIGLELVPASLVGRTVEPRASLRGEVFIDVLPGEDPWPARPVESLIQLKLVGDPYPGAFAQGHTMRNSETIDRFRFDTQTVDRSPEATTIVTTLRTADGLTARHHLTWRTGEPALRVHCELENGSSVPVTLEMFASFSISGITPFDSADAAGRLFLHRFRSVWSAEGRHECLSFEDLHLERSWSGAGAFSERFGQLGTMPVRRWFPTAAIEDRAAGVVWGASLAWAGSWQIEAFRQHDDAALSGGLADREFGHWMKSLAPGASFATPPAVIGCVHGGIDDWCDRHTAMQAPALASQPEVEQDLPVIFNEWCTTWGDPSHANLCAIADRLQGSGVRYLVIDAGWYKSDGTDWSSGHGDWVPSRSLFPDGLAATAEAIRGRGLIPGLWYEMETVGSQSAAFARGAHFLERDGIPVTVRQRRFWDLCDPAAVAYLTEAVIGRLRSCGFGYLKVDYNETAGLGSDDADSPGEGLRRQVEGGYDFFRRIRSSLPELVIENCSSGGHRLEPSMMGLTAMSSFSDAHELVEIPLIAANLHRLILPRQNQIWAVLHPQDDARRLTYSLTATFLGRMCLSGGVEKLSDGSWDLVLRAIDLYRRCAPVIRDGVSRRYGETGPSWRHPQGWQSLVRTGGGRALVVTHTFDAPPESASVPLPGDWVVEDSFGATTVRHDGGTLHLGLPGPFTGSVHLLRRA